MENEEEKRGEREEYSRGRKPAVKEAYDTQAQASPSSGHESPEEGSVSGARSDDPARL